MLDDDEGQPAIRHDLQDDVTHLLGRVAVQHGEGLIQEEQLRRQGQRPRQREPLGLPAGEGSRRGVGRHRQPDVGEQGRNQLVHGGARHTDVLGAEGDVPLHGGGDQARARLLQDQPDQARPRPGVLACDPHAARAVARVGRLQQAREGAQERRLAGAAGTDEQHPLTGGDVQVEVGEDPLAAAVGPPAQPADLDPATLGCGRGHASAPEGDPAGAGTGSGADADPSAGADADPGAGADAGR